MDKNRYLIELSKSGRTEFGRFDFTMQGHEQRVFSAIWALESQVNNGGFIKYFDCEDSEVVGFAPAALRAIGALACADIVTQAAALAPNRRLPDVIDKLANLDEEFYSYPDNLTDLLYAYVVSHPTIFGHALSQA